MMRGRVDLIIRGRIDLMMRGRVDFIDTRDMIRMSNKVNLLFVVRIGRWNYDLFAWIWFILGCYSIEVLWRRRLRQSIVIKHLFLLLMAMMLKFYFRSGSISMILTLSYIF